MFQFDDCHRIKQVGQLYASQLLDIIDIIIIIIIIHPTCLQHLTVYSIFTQNLHHLSLNLLPCLSPTPTTTTTRTNEFHTGKRGTCCSQTPSLYENEGGHGCCWTTGEGLQAVQVVVRQTLRLRQTPCYLPTSDCSGQSLFDGTCTSIPVFS